MIHIPLYGNWFVITPEYGSHNISIHYSGPTTFPSLPTLLILELHNLSMDRSDEELQFEDIQLTWIKMHPTGNPSTYQLNTHQSRKSSKMSTHHLVHIPT